MPCRQRAVRGRRRPRGGFRLRSERAEALDLPARHAHELPPRLHRPHRGQAPPTSTSSALEQLATDVPSPPRQPTSTRRPSALSSTQAVRDPDGASASSCTQTRGSSSTEYAARRGPPRRACPRARGRADRRRTEASAAAVAARPLPRRRGVILFHIDGVGIQSVAPADGERRSEVVASVGPAAARPPRSERRGGWDSNPGGGRGWDSNPRGLARPTAFKAAPFDRSGTPPERIVTDA